MPAAEAMPKVASIELATEIDPEPETFAEAAIFVVPDTVNTRLLLTDIFEEFKMLTILPVGTVILPNVVVPVPLMSMSPDPDVLKVNIPANPSALNEPNPQILMPPAIVAFTFPNPLFIAKIPPETLILPPIERVRAEPVNLNSLVPPPVDITLRSP